ncbi:hypothetical protein FNF27_02642 [Cafeteria roenbergensis]|uniref:Anaphase-promoting complex subunit 4 WD40 domain-containing protein n=1 Tax=Cafeteria roenbergensis TaxID=33653 RepID=A0A5A8EJE9_CAFRO|nr:hypothetical protein FNF27_02642 [Cafeteria roenbergensis]
MAQASMSSSIRSTASGASSGDDEVSVSPRLSLAAATAEAPSKAEQDKETLTVGPAPGPLTFGQAVYINAGWWCVRCPRDAGGSGPDRMFIAAANSPFTYVYRHLPGPPFNYQQWSKSQLPMGLHSSTVAIPLGADYPSTAAFYSAADEYGAVRVVQTDTGNPLFSWRADPRICTMLDWRWDSQIMVAALRGPAYQGSVAMWEPWGQITDYHIVNTDWCMSAYFNPNPVIHELASVSLDGTMTCYEQTGGVTYQVKWTNSPGAGPLWAMSYAPNGADCYVGSASGEVVAYWMKFNIEIMRFNIGEHIWDMSVCEKDGSTWIALACTTGFYIWDVTSMSIIAHIMEVPPGGSPATCTSVNWTYDASELATAWLDGNIRIYSVGSWPPPPPPPPAKAAAAAAAEPTA